MGTVTWVSSNWIILPPSWRSSWGLKNDYPCCEGNHVTEWCVLANEMLEFYLGASRKDFAFPGKRRVQEESSLVLSFLSFCPEGAYGKRIVGPMAAIFIRLMRQNTQGLKAILFRMMENGERILKGRRKDRKKKKNEPSSLRITSLPLLPNLELLTSGFSICEVIA